EIARERDAFFITFTIQEGQSFNIGKVSVVSEIEGVDAAEFEAMLKMRPGVTYSPAIIDNNISRMESLTLKKGLNFVRIDPRITRNERDLTLDIEFALVRGPKVFVERIDVEGNTTTLDQVVRRQFRTVEGDPFNPREVRQSAERIRALGFFSDARVNAEPGSSTDQVVVKVGVDEQPTGSLSLGVSYSVASGPGFNIGLTESNFLGRGQFIGVNIATGTDNINSSITFTEPFFLGRDLAFKFTAFYNTTDNDNSFYSTRSIGISPALEFPISEFGRLELRYKLGEDKIFSVDRGDLANPGLDNGSSVILLQEEAQGALLASSIGYTFSYDTRLNGLDPKGGFLLRFGQDFAGLGGDIDRITTTALGLAERRVFSEDVTLRVVVEGGAVHMLNGDSRVTDRFFGNGKIRGFEINGLGPRDLAATNEDNLGGNLFAVARFEADFPLGLPEEYGITGGLFMDVGSVWSLDNVSGTGGNLVDDDLHLRSSIGFSIFWTTPLGPLRLNFSKAIKKKSYDSELPFDLTVSTKF
ncbi:MAG: outer membrane protein assembly factor BamA, partial [Paracoccaceae bacterium]|nr:outer membrane protein assembly factor BamA [Paracoccaceae bacterium]